VTEDLNAQVLQDALPDRIDEIGLEIRRTPVEERRDEEGDDHDRESLHVAVLDVVHRKARQQRRREA
jgi:hypothetical protein